MKRIVFKLVSAVLALCILSSCSSMGIGDTSSVVTGNENQSSIISSESLKEETSSLPVISEKEDSEENPPFIPENNPEPVKANRENAWEPTAVSYTEKMEGTPIDYKAKILTGPSCRGRDLISVVRSYDEFKKVYEQEPKFYNKGEDYLELYDESSFEDSIMIMFLSTRGSRKRKYTIDEVSRKNDRMYIFMNENEISSGGIGPSVGIHYRAFISISKQDFEGIEDIVVCRD